MKPRFSLLTAIVWLPLLAGLGPGESRCAEGDASPSAAAAAEPLRFRRIYAPAERLADWPFGNLRYVPIEKAEFERLLALLEAAPDPRASVAAHLLDAQYQAHLSGSLLAEGQATLKVLLSAQAPALLPLDPCGLAISKATWAGAEPADAILGLGEEGKLEVLVERSGQLQCAWSLEGHREAGEAIGFQVELPRCPSNRFLLDLPENMTLLCDRGLVQQPGGAEAGMRRWRIELGGHHRFRLRVVPAEVSQPHQQLALVQVSLTYDFSLRGVDLSAQLKFEVHNEPLGQVTLALDSGLQLVTARCGDAPVPWSVISPGDGGETRMVLTLPEAIQDSECVLRLRAIAPLETDQLYQLPRIRPEGVFWREGSASLSINSPLVIKQLVPVRCRQSDAGPLSSPHVGESVQFEYFAPDASVQVVLARRSAAAQLTSGTVVELGRGEASARVAADFRIAEGAQFSLEADLSAQWLLDSVESVPAEAIDDWSLEKQEGNRRKLLIQLAKALAPDRPLRLIIAARRPRFSLRQKLALDELVPLRFRGAADSKRLVAVRAAEAYQLEVAGAEQLRQVDVRSLEASELELFAEPPRGLLFEDGPGAADLRVSLGSRKPGYAATIEVEAGVGDATLQESYTLHCVPEAAEISRVLVHFSHPRDVPLRWTLGSEDPRQLSARPLSIDEQTAAAVDADQETWEIKLLRPRSTPFEIRAEREVKLADRQAVSLAWLPQAAEQRATLVIHSLSPKTLQIKSDRLQPIPVADVPPNRHQTARAAYRYDPLRDTAAAPDPAVTISASAAAKVPRAWVWNCDLESWYEADGSGRHRASYWVQSSGGGQMRLTLPAAAAADEVRDVRLDGNRIAWQRSEDNGRTDLVIALPPAEKFPHVSVQFLTRARGLGMIGSLEPPLPEGDLPVLARHWTLWLPPGYGSLDPDPHGQPFASPRLSWSRRLFGPLGRAAGQPAFDLLDRTTWPYPVADRSPRLAAQRNVEQLVQLLGVSGARRGAGREIAPADWAGLLDQPSLDALQIKLLVDRHALAQLGLTPQTPVRLGSGDTPWARGVDLLQRSGLALLVHPQVILLTGQTEAALLHAWLAPLERPGLWGVLPGPLGEKLQQAADAADDPAMLPAEIWRRGPPQPKVLWSWAGPPGNPAADTLGWTAYRTEICDGAAPRLWFVHRQTMDLLGSVVFLLVIAWGWWRCGGRPVFLGILSCLFGAAALLLPEALVPVASGATLGTIFCLALELVRRPAAAATSASQPQPNPPSPQPVSSPSAPSIVLLLAATMALACRAYGAEPADKPPPIPPPVYRVFIPIDAQQQPTGERYFLPEEFYKQLDRRTAALSDKPRGWLIGAATYRGTLTRDAASEQLVIDELKASFDLHVLGPAARIRIPLRREGANLLPNGALLDNRQIQPDWEADGRALLFEVAQPGRYRLELALRPTMHLGSASAGFDLAVPPLATARLELALPSGAPAIEVPLATGAVRREEEPRRLTADLGPSDRLSVRWPSGGSAGGAGPAVDVEELLWLKVRPGSLVLDAKFKLKIIEGQVRQLPLATDPRLRLLPLSGADAPTAEVRALPGQLQTILLQWPHPLADRTVVEATFLLTGSSGVGNLRPPQLEVLDARTTRRWMAVSVDPSLEHEERGAGQFEAVAVPDFLGAWGKSDAQPLLAFRLGSAEATWSMSTRPREPHTTIEQTLNLSCAEEGTAVAFDAQLVTTSGYSFQLRLAAPAELEIERVSLLEDGVERASRWSQDEHGVVTVFLTEPVAGRQTFALRGHLPTPLRKRIPLPRINFEQGQVTSSTIQLFRRPSVLVALVGRATGLVEAEPGRAEAGKTEWGRLVQAFRVDAAQPTKLVLTVTPNRAQVSGEQVTWLRHRRDSWWADVDFRIRAVGGVVDQLRIAAPAPFGGPYKIGPPATLKVVDTPGEGRELIVQPGSGQPKAVGAPQPGNAVQPKVANTALPKAALAERYQLSISSPLAMGPADRVAAPDIKLRPPIQVTRFLALPKQYRGRPIIWETQGLKPSELPDDFPLPPDAASFTKYQVAEEPPRAVLGTSDSLRSTPRVRLADICIAWQSDGALSGVATFDVEPGKSAECQLWLPPASGLVHVSVADVPTDPIAVGANTWRLPLRPARLPQRIEVVFTGHLPHPPGGAQRRFDAPALGDLPIAETLWSIIGPPGLQCGQPEGSQPLSPCDYALSRLKNIAAMIQSAAALSGDDLRETLRWYRPWARRLVAARRTVEQRLSELGDTPESRAAKAEVHTLDAQQSGLAGRLGTLNELGQISAEASLVDAADEIWDGAIVRPHSALHCGFREGVKSITLTSRRAEADGLPNRLLLAAGLVTLIPLLLLALRRKGWWRWLKKWPQAVGVGVGLAWWLWLWPSLLGWGIIALSIVALLHSAGKRAPAATPSTIVSLRSPTR
jgi:hypothetical protein